MKIENRAIDRYFDRRKSFAMRPLLIIPVSLTITAGAHAVITNVAMTRGGLVAPLQPGYTQIEAFNLQGPDMSRNGINFVGEDMTDGIGGAATISLGVAGVLSATNAGSSIDELFYTQLATTPSGPGSSSFIQINFENLDPSRFYFFEAYLGENRSTLGTCNFVHMYTLSGTDITYLPEFSLGNGIADEDPPAALDRMTVSASIYGVPRYSFSMPPGVGPGGAESRLSLAGYQLQSSLIPEPRAAIFCLLGTTVLIGTRRRKRAVPLGIGAQAGA